MRVGVDYYPEHWNPELWEQDAQVMQDAGVTLARLAEFAWCCLEPVEGRYDLDWLDRAIATLYRHNIQVILGTPTATPPNWLVEKYPDVLPVDQYLHPIYPGVRCHRCYNSPSLAEHAGRIIQHLSAHYATNPAVIGWQTDNEFGLIECHCENCRSRFREWLKQKYGTLETINRKWGTVVWSGEFTSWTQINTPLGGSPHHNPSYLLDYYRFCSDSAVAFQDQQLAIIRRNCPDHFITHNIWGYPVMLDYGKLGRNLDFVSHDYYPDTDFSSDPDQSIYHGALSHDLVRGVKNRNFWVMEQLSGTPGCWSPMSRAPYPGMIRAYAWQSVSRGADAVLHFRWRSATIGAEQFWHGLIDHSNVPGRRFAEFMQFAREIREIGPQLDGTGLRNQVALLHSHEQYTAFKIQPQVKGMDYFANLKNLHHAFLELGVGTDVIDGSANYEGYQIIVAPHLFLLDEATAQRLAAFAAQGGTLVLTNRSGVKNPNNVCWMQPLPGLLTECAGMSVTEYDPVGQSPHRLKFDDGREYVCNQWCDIIATGNAKAFAWYADDYFAGQPAATVNHYGQGKVYYIGTHSEPSFYRDLFNELAREKGIAIFQGLPEGVEISVREKDQKQFMFVLNLTPESKTVMLDREYQSVLHKKTIDRELVLNPFEVEILGV